MPLINYPHKLKKRGMVMKCPKCECENVTVTTSTFTKSKSRSFLWNLFMCCITCGIWLIWMLVRKKKEVVVTETHASCQGCGYSWKIR